jgi:hypothetical protein
MIEFELSRVGKLLERAVGEVDIPGHLEELSDAPLFAVIQVRHALKRL